ncbi:hypothetical protein NQZ68_017506 [Dissostichus eleginoides]|nr:hypothetical protein NQZ68_017506 [Dissostichus eleginoides]
MEEPGPSRKKRFVSEEKRKFQEKWSNAYFVLPQGSDKVICLICKQTGGKSIERLCSLLVIAFSHNAKQRSTESFKASRQPYYPDNLLLP